LALTKLVTLIEKRCTEEKKVIAVIYARTSTDQVVAAEK
jgi:hypothetical protein